MYFLYRDLEWHRAVPVIFLLLHSLLEHGVIDAGSFGFFAFFQRWRRCSEVLCVLGYIMTVFCYWL